MGIFDSFYFTGVWILNEQGAVSGALAPLNSQHSIDSEF
jgi:hypothetical protein